MDIYATDLAGRSLPKRRLGDAGVPASVAYALVRDELILDGNSRQNLATFCLYVLKLDPMVLAGAVAGARNCTTAMRAISDKSKSSIPSFGYPVPYALSTVVFLIYGYLAMLLS